MTSEALDELKWQRPFQPFRVVTTENQIFDVPHPGLILVAGNDVNIGMPHPEEPPPMVSDVMWLNIENIVRVELLTRLERTL